MPSRKSLVLITLLGALLIGWLAWRHSSLPQNKEPLAANVEKQPVNFVNRTFDPASPPDDMPPLAPGEEAECDSDFRSNASVGGKAEQTDTTHAIVTVTQIKVALQLNITIWAPNNATPHVIEHEEGHRQISENYYQTSDKVARQIAAAYMGKQVLITGTDLNGELNKSLQEMSAEITDEYSKELNPEPAQQRYDDITDHSRNEVAAKDAVARALHETLPASI